jgi:hypothetical protein
VSTSSTSAADDPHKRHRLSIDLDPKAKQLVDDILKRAGNISNAELFRRSVALYGAMLSLHEHQGSVVFRHADGREERVVLF